MAKQTPHPENGELHNFVRSLSKILAVLEYAENDPDTGTNPADAIGVCISELTQNILKLNEEFGSDWPENK